MEKFVDVNTLNERDLYIAEEMYKKNVLRKVRKGTKVGYKTFKQKEIINHRQRNKNAIKRGVFVVDKGSDGLYSVKNYFNKSNDRRLPYEQQKHIFQWYNKNRRKK